MGETYRQHAELIGELWSTGLTVFAVDLTGQGLSVPSGNEAAPHHIERIEQVIAELREFLTQIVFSETTYFALWGHCFGGLVAALYAAEYPTHVQRMVLSVPMLGVHGGPYPVAVARMVLAFRCWIGRSHSLLSEWRHTIGRIGVHERSQGITKTQRYAYWKESGIQFCGPSNGWYREAFRGSQMIAKRAHSVVIPSLVLQAGKDMKVRNSEQDCFCQRAPRALKITIPDACHGLLLENDERRARPIMQALKFLSKMNQSAQQSYTTSLPLRAAM